MTLLQTYAGWTERGVRHGFSARQGGVSAAPFDALNMAENVGDDALAVAENQRRFAAAIGVEATRVFEVNQVHGGLIRVVEAHTNRAILRREDADALLTNVPGVAVAVRVADCVAVLLHAGNGRVVAAAHSGWRGTVANIVGHTVAALCVRAECDADAVHALICPHIGVEAFEVGDEVVEALSRALPGVHGLVQAGARRPHINLGRAIEAQLRAAGLPPEHIARLDGCTHSDSRRFFSFRRDGQRSGRHLAAIVAGC